ncbi:MAG: 4-hydroxy-tetrahydrodipicolinate reductase, partial [Alphaproteobacteria bacterium]|nr:4-hydroxy-tetrahydrodipicolinate reductase [Alphaproteobacteria bacterium]
MKIGIVGAAGRMGLANIRQVIQTPGLELAGAIERPDAAELGKDAGLLAGIDKLGIAITSDPVALFKASDAVIDFTRPEPTLAFAALAAEHAKIHVIGTTGFEPTQIDRLKRFGGKARIVHSPNMSLCVNLLFALVKQAAAALDDSFDIEILEMHHRHKVDAPSGPALA